ncbi:hypothetical protein MTR67_035186, partial [Solanum verrucosum]
AKRVKLCLKSMNDPSRFPLRPTPPLSFPAKTVLQAPLVQGPHPRSLNRLKAEGFRTIMEEKRLSIDSVVERELLLKGKKKASAFKPDDFLVVWGKKIKCRSTKINVILGCSFDFMHYYHDLIKKKTIEDPKGWLAPLLSNVTPRWIEACALIEKKDLSFAARY